ncbi:hypothetical protein Gogos_018678 [Gossypium gossypioides]|uniref:Histone H2A n=1 Tax=Gossypium gossypioides TaxID=34282 RepID=A0A7J9BES9_GOSGO|nr:hypothetical protein [Gossypium gossypioides]
MESSVRTDDGIKGLTKDSNESKEPEEGSGPKKKPVSRSVKAGLQFPVGRIGRYLKKGRYSQRVETGAPVYLAADVISFFTKR